MAATAVQNPRSSITGLDNQQQLESQVDIMSDAASVKSRYVNAILNYYKPNEDGSPPLPAYVDRPETHELPVDHREVAIRDVRGEENLYNLEENGFQFLSHTSTVSEFSDEEHIKTAYYPEAEQLLKAITSASRVFIFGHTVRRQEADINTGADPLGGPIHRVHVDQSYTSSLARVAYHLPSQHSELTKGRVQIINLWRPISTIQKVPLAIADARSVPDSDLVVSELIYPERRSETFALKANEGHRWYYKSELTPDEIILIKCFDSKVDGRARRAPHTAFTDPSSKPDAPYRESIEVRALVFHEDDRE
ncbi:hypothetical protein BJX70DRAFT_402344 [Aspergillus crustosus]